MTTLDSRVAGQGAVPASWTPYSGVGRDAGRTTAWLGVLAVTGAAAWLGTVGLRALLDAHDLSGVLASARGVAVGPIVLVVIAALLLAELRWPAVRRPLLCRAHLVDAGYLVLFAFVVLPLLTLVETGFATEIERHARFLILSRLALVPRVAVVGLILLGIDLMNWAAHVANHRYLTLWRLHAVHHSQEDMGALTTFRVHPLVHASYLPSVVPVLVLGASGTLPGAALIAYGCYVVLAHANLRFSFGPLGRVFVSPAYHRIHHASTPIDARGAVNFGFVLVCWDQLLHRAVFPGGEAPRATGIEGRPVPVEQAGHLSRVPRVVLAQMAQPFRIHSATDGPS
jgi:sterol desaturase/sphingolipid hydroxylase (fatty acid hydroxylase superfamily)